MYHPAKATGFWLKLAIWRFGEMLGKISLLASGIFDQIDQAFSR
jgi:hypothetical protein